MRDTRITVCARTPIIEEGKGYLLLDDDTACRADHYHIEIAIGWPESDVRLTEDAITINDLHSVSVLGAYQVAF